MAEQVRPNLALFEVADEGCNARAQPRQDNRVRLVSAGICQDPADTFNCEAATAGVPG
jgi:hypothetical protein